jgi:hypothetical protein
MRRDSPRQARSVAPEPAARFPVRNWPRLLRPCCAEKAASHFQTGTMGRAARLGGVRDVLMAILTATRAGSCPALPVVCNMVNRHDGREDHSRVVRTSGRRGLCRRDHARRRSPAHFESTDCVLRAALPRAPGRRPRSSGQKMDLWSLLHAHDKQDGLRRRHLRAAGDPTIKQTPSSP